MILPTTYMTTLLLAVLSMVCWGSWANTQKMTGRWRSELYFIDFAIGVLMAAIVAAATFGTISGGFVETDTLMLSVMDNLSVARRVSLGAALLAGGVFNLANMLLLAGIALAGMSVAFPFAIGVALAAAVVWSYFLNPGANPTLLFSGAGAVVAAVVASALSYRSLILDKAAAPLKDASSGKQPAPTTARQAFVARPPNPRELPKSTFGKAMLLSVICGVLMSCFMPLVALSEKSEVGLGPYTACLIVAVGVVLSAPVIGLVFMNLPVEGHPIGFGDYFKRGLKRHLLGVAGGCLWGTGTAAYFVAVTAPRVTGFRPVVVEALGYGAALLAALWGLVVWKEFAGARRKTLGLVVAVFVLFAAGLVLMVSARS